MFAAALALTVARSPGAPRSGDPELALARDYVLAACLMERYAGSPLATEADAWARGLVERGSISLLAYPELARIGRTEAPEPLTARDGGRLLLQSCMALYNSPGLPGKILRVLHR